MYVELYTVSCLSGLVLSSVRCSNQAIALYTKTVGYAYIIYIIYWATTTLWWLINGRSDSIAWTRSDWACHSNAVCLYWFWRWRHVEFPCGRKWPFAGVWCISTMIDREMYLVLYPWFRQALRQLNTELRSCSCLFPCHVTCPFTHEIRGLQLLIIGK